MELRWIPAGEFMTGSRGSYPDEEPRHRVVIGRGFRLGMTPVPQAQFEAWTRSHMPPDGPHQNRFKDGSRRI
jgi:formylglycine-generating enzyme required for sulfatase activity